MLALWWFGGPVKEYLGRARFIGLYFAAGLAGSAGALLQSPTTPVLGASGAIFGILGAMLILEWQATGRLGGNAMTLIVINLVISFAIPNISWGGHVGRTDRRHPRDAREYARWGRGHAAYGRLGLYRRGDRPDRRLRRQHCDRVLAGPRLRVAAQDVQPHPVVVAVQPVRVAASDADRLLRGWDVSAVEIGDPRQARRVPGSHPFRGGFPPLAERLSRPVWQWKP